MDARPCWRVGITETWSHFVINFQITNYDVKAYNELHEIGLQLFHTLLVQLKKMYSIIHRMSSNFLNGHIPRKPLMSCHTYRGGVIYVQHRHRSRSVETALDDGHIQMLHPAK